MIKKKIISGIIWSKTASGRMILTISKRRKRFSENKHRSKAKEENDTVICTYIMLARLCAN